MSIIAILFVCIFLLVSIITAMIFILRLSFIKNKLLLNKISILQEIDYQKQKNIDSLKNNQIKSNEIKAKKNILSNEVKNGKKNNSNIINTIIDNNNKLSNN